jgi:2-polyprenyl-3-methyl-5-hydroxy-6-metoxy-1,4-benzoquinol methylase
MKCRHCNSELENVLIDLQHSPVSNDLLKPEQLKNPEIYYPLKVYICHKCYLVQIDEFKKSADIFNDEYVYFSSYSTTWLEHSKAYALKMIERFLLTSDKLVVEIASNDGYLLQYFKENKIPVLGIEPTKSTADVAIAKKINTVIDFFSEEFAHHEFKVKKADLLVGNNVLAHVPDINDFVKGLKVALANNGVITMEFPHLLNLIEQNQFDTIYHEHFSYLSLIAVKGIFEQFGLHIFDVEEIPTHGGSLRIYAKHSNDETKKIEPTVKRLLEKEINFGIDNIDTYSSFKEKVQKVKTDFLEFLIQKKKEGKKIAAYGAAAKGNTLLNYCGIKNDLIDFCVDASPHKQGKFMPGSHIPIVESSELKKQRPDYVVIFPWNIKEEIVNQHSYIDEWNGKFVVAIPEIAIVTNLRNKR